MELDEPSQPYAFFVHLPAALQCASDASDAFFHGINANENTLHTSHSVGSKGMRLSIMASAHERFSSMT
uniref:Uncharacterized protein n=1 Tax=Octopus bimaculoides TaxID=37653 RepID=A0A0L8I579_OCTBM